MLPVLMNVKSRREEYAEATRRALLDAATGLFAERGYAATSVEDIARAARVTRGALYHHFAGKRDVFEAVFEELETATIPRLLPADGADEDPWALLLAGFDGVLEVALEPTYQRIALVDAPAVLGWARWRELAEHHVLGLLREVLAGLMSAGLLRPQPPDLLARLLLAALVEAALTIASAPDQDRARSEASLLLRDLLEGLRAQPGGAAQG
jgi:AcrR family transcriptional regulator